MKNEDRIRCFNRELNWIQNPGMKKLAEILICNAPECFFHVPASSSGKHHPDFARHTDGGLVLHTKEVCHVLHMIISEQELWALPVTLRDALYVAAISHDMMKYGNVPNKGTRLDHPALASEFIGKTYKLHEQELETYMITPGMVYDVQQLVAAHMGIWGNPAPTTTLQNILCVADVIASRKEWNPKFTDEDDIIVNMLNSKIATSEHEKV